MFSGMLNGMTYTCSQCHQVFEKPGERPYVYCSRSCFHASRRTSPTVQRTPRQRQTPSARDCKWCGATFISKPSAGARVSYCSRSCQAFASVQQPKPQKLSVPDAAYLAGIIDGEGHIGHQWRPDRPNSTRQSLTLVVLHTHLPLLEWIEQVTGTGTVRAHKKTNGVVRSNKPQYSWRCGSWPAAMILTQIAPYMIEKQELALVAAMSQLLPGEPGSPAASLTGGTVPSGA